MIDKYNLTQEQNVFLAKKILVSNIYNSAKLEGLNVTYPDTKTILDGVNVPSLKLDTITCILNLRDAWKELLCSLNNEINLEYICKINSFVSRNESLEWGKLRTGNVGIGGTDYIPNIPDDEVVSDDLKKILEINNITLRAIKMMLYGMRSQLFWDGNKRTSMLIANKIMIQNGKGIISINDKYIYEFNVLLTHYYETGDDGDIINFIYENCIYGIEME